jgi:hypothetical protein
MHERMVSLRVNEDGSFISVERVPAGDYRFTAIFKNVSVTRMFTVSAGDEQLPEVNLGSIALR